MNTPVLERTSAAKAGWVIAALLIGWLVFLFLPGPVEEQVAKPPAIAPAVTSLTRAGLPDYTDWVGLPEVFAIWADKAEWKDGKTRFAYWHPVMKDYSYYFEATRVEGGYRFREIPKPRDDNYEWDSGAPEDCPILFFLPKASEYTGVLVTKTDRGARVLPAPKKVEIDLPTAQSLSVPPAPSPRKSDP